MSGKLRLNGATSGYSELQAPDVAGDQTYILPSVGGELVTKQGGGSVVGYQQGLWTCVLNGSSSGNTVITAGQYIWSRVGDQVFIDFTIAGGDKTTSGDVTLQGLPYTASSACNQYTGFVGDRQGITYGPGYDDIYVRINGGEGDQSKIQVMQKNDNDHGQLNNGGGNLTSSCVMRGHISYRTNDTTWVPINGATIS